MVLGGHVERGGYDLAFYRALHVRNLFGTLVNQEAHEVHLGVIRADSGRNIFEDSGLAGFRRAYDQAALAFANRAHEINDACRDGALAMLHSQAFVRIHRCEIAETHAVAALLDRGTVDSGDLLDSRVLLVLTGRARLPRNEIAFAQPVAPNGGKPHVAVSFARQVPLRSEETVPVSEDV